MADDSIIQRLRDNPFLKSCGTLAMEAITLGAMSRQAERERLEVALRATFPDEWETVLATMDKFDRASASRVSPYVQQMWLRGECTRDAVFALWDRCPAAFRDHHPLTVIGRAPAEILPKLAAALP